MSSNSSWQKIRFDQICRNVSKRIDNPNESKYKKFVGLEHLDTLEPKITRYGSTNDVISSMTLFKNTQILFGRRNWYLRRVAVADFDGICSGDIYVLESINRKIIKDFLPLLMHSDEFFEKNMMYSHGSMSTRVKWSNLAKLEFVIPSIPEQKNILLVMQKIDDAVSNTQKLLEKTKNYMITKRELLLTRGIGHTKFKKVKGLFGKHWEIPEEWEIKSTSEILKITMGQSPPSESYNQEKNGLRFYQGVTDFGTIYPTPTVWCTDPKKIAEENSILFSVRAPVGEINITKKKCCLGRGIAALNSSKNNLLYCYYLLLQNKNQFLIYSQGTTYDAINRNEIENTKLAYTKNIEEQQKIASTLSNIDNQIKYLENHLSKLKTMRRSIINEKLTLPKMGNKLVQ